ncbi:glycosyltransferase family 2 protein [Bacillus pumilus]|uniref:glycosyltransferase family 2 protein n=1 Tax=Bacillus pumilus TaxID=1408 RepID=UPI00203C11A7|nr:glycosyltransferase family 2 protein [Bacillus pumilus]MCM3035924.1 glycosyltransferase family 2 protein [Bacillus pumilus]
MLFSIIVPIYNTEKYLYETLDSVVNQSIDFEQNVQLILVDDGSTDKSNEICSIYKRKYPKNIIYIKNNNSGPSVTRNIGLELVNESSEYIGFLDSDDKLSKDALFHIKEFFHKETKVRIAVLPIHYFGCKQGEHKLNYRFHKGNRVINILHEYNYPHYYIGGSFFKRSLFDTHNFKFDENVKFWEDALFMNKLILKETCYGVVSKSKYYYRKREENNSLVDNSWFLKEKYSHMLKNSYNNLIELSKEYHNEILPYIQYLLIYHMKLYMYPRNREIILTVLNEQELREFVDLFVDILRQIDNKYIVEQNMNSYYIELMLELKGVIKPEQHFMDKLVDKKVKITNIKFYGTFLVISGHFINELYAMKKEDRIYIKYLNKKIYGEKIFLDHKINIWGYTVRDYKYAGFKMKIPSWVFKFSICIEGENFNVMLNEINFIKSFIKKSIEKIRNYKYKEDDAK